MIPVRRAAVHRALTALMLCALLPAGWIPNPDAANGSAFVICTMYGPLTAPGGREKPANLDSRDHQSCPFAAAAHLAPPLQQARLALPATAVEMAIVPTQPAFVVADAEFVVRSSRAPPQNL